MMLHCHGQSSLRSIGKSSGPETVEIFWSSCELVCVSFEKCGGVIKANNDLVPLGTKCL
jgi:hypothetical protein